MEGMDGNNCAGESATPLSFTMLTNITCLVVHPAKCGVTIESRFIAVYFDMGFLRVKYYYIFWWFQAQRSFQARYSISL